MRMLLLESDECDHLIRWCRDQFPKDKESESFYLFNSMFDFINENELDVHDRSWPEIRNMMEAQ